MYEPLFLYTNSGISENPTFKYNSFHACGKFACDATNVTPPPLVGRALGVTAL